MDYEERINQCQFITAKGETLYLRNGILSRHTINFPGSNEYEYLFTQIWYLFLIQRFLKLLIA